MSDVIVTWHGPRITAEVAAAVTRAMTAAGAALATATQERVATPYPPASSPGQPPHLRSGGLQGAITSRVVTRPGEVALSVGVEAGSSVAPQAAALAQGTSRMAARPFLGEAAAAGALVIQAVQAEVARSFPRS